MELEDLVALEHAGWDALCEHRGGTFYSDLMTDDAVMVLVNGAVMDRDTIACSLDQAPPWDHYEITNPRLLQHCADCASLLYQATAARGSDTFTALMTSTYALVDGRPRLTLYTQTTKTH